MIRILTILGMLSTAAALTHAAESASSDSTLYLEPVLLTSAGQSYDALIVRGLCLRAGIDVRYCSQADADSIDGAKTLFLVAGGSTKGLGAAKKDVSDEERRVDSLIKSCRKAGIPIVVFHVGGEARRGAISDPFNAQAAASASELVVLTTGDRDGFFRKIADKRKIPYTPIEKLVDAVDVLNNMFRTSPDDK